MRNRYPGVDQCASFMCWAIMQLTNIVVLGFRIVILALVHDESGEINDLSDCITKSVERMDRYYRKNFTE